MLSQHLETRKLTCILTFLVDSTRNPSHHNTARKINVPVDKQFGKKNCIHRQYGHHVENLKESTQKATRTIIRSTYKYQLYLCRL